MNTIEVIKSPFDIRDYKIKAESILPIRYSCPIKVPVKNQGSKPTCVAHAAASLVEYHHKRQNNKKYKAFSTEFIYGTRDPGYYDGDGMVIKDALKTLQKYGDLYKTDCPGNNTVETAVKNISKKQEFYRELAYPNRISAYYRCSSKEDIKTALTKYGPVLASMTTYTNAKIVDDFYTYDTSEKPGRHCVMIYGYDERGWLIQNSWGATYAGDGRFVLPFDYKFNEAWGIADDIIENSLTIKKENAFTEVLYKILNAFINMFISKT